MFEKRDIKIDAKVIRILDIVSDEDLETSSQILACAMVVNYDTRVNKQEGIENNHPVTKTQKLG